MQRRPLFWFVVSLLCLGGWPVYFWKLGDEWQRERMRPRSGTETKPTPPPRPSFRLRPSHNPAPNLRRSQRTFSYRLSNTDKTLKQLIRDDKAIILENALIDTANPLAAIPEHLRAPKNNDSYICPGARPADDRFRARLSGASAASFRIFRTTPTS